MNKITKADLDRVASRAMAPEGPYIKVGMSSPGIAAGADEVFSLLGTESAQATNSRNGKTWRGKCARHAEPLVEVSVDGLPAITVRQGHSRNRHAYFGSTREEKRMVA